LVRRAGGTRTDGCVKRQTAQGIEVRAGLHTGECEVLGDDIGGIGVQIGALGPSTLGAQAGKLIHVRLHLHHPSRGAANQRHLPGQPINLGLLA